MPVLELVALLLWVSIFLVSVVFHELCHGWTAYHLGDDTAKRAGRLSLNPLRHIDPVWTVFLPGLLFVATGGRFAIGMAKPVPVNFSRLLDPRRDMIWVALAGPLANLVLAAALTIAFHFSGWTFLFYAIYFNLGLAIFNMIPIPPLDGSKVLAGLLPGGLARWYLGTEPLGTWVILALYFSGLLYYLIVPAMNALCRLLALPTLEVHF